MAIILSWVVGIPVGILSALRQNSTLDYIVRFFTVLFLAIPGFWLGAMIVLVLLLWWDYAPPLGVINIWDDPTKICSLRWGLRQCWGSLSQPTSPA